GGERLVLGTDRPAKAARLVRRDAERQRAPPALHEAGRRQRVDDLVRDDRGIERRIRQRVQPADARREPREPLALPVSQVRAPLENQILVERHAERRALLEELLRERAGARSEL